MQLKASWITLDTLPVPALLLDLNGLLIEANRLAIELADGASARLVQATLQSLTDPLVCTEPAFSLVEMDLKGLPGWLMARRQRCGDQILVLYEDKTEQHRLALAQEASEAVQRLARVGLWSYEVGAPTVYWSDQVCRIHGVPPGYSPALDEAINFYAREGRQTITEAVEQAMQTGRPFDVELPILTTQDQALQVRAIGEAQFEQGVCVRIYGTFQDITAQKDTEWGLLRDLELVRRYERLFEESNAMLAIANLDGFFVELNGAWEDTLGYSLEELCARPFTDFVHPDDIARTQREAAALFEPGYNTISFTNRYICKDGSVVHLRWNSTCDLSAGRTYAVAQNVTADRALQARLERLALIVSRTDNAVTITDADQRIEWINEGFTRLTGYSFEEARGQRPGQLLQGPQTDPAERDRIRRHLKAREGFDAELLNYRKDGTTYWVAIEVQPLFDEQGQLDGYMAIVSDITERKRSELALIEARASAEAAAHKAEAANKAKSEFLAMMSHELRTPMNGVLGTTELLEMTTLSAEQQAFVEAIQNSGRGLLNILNDMLDLTRIEAGRLDLAEAPFKVCAVIEEGLALLESRASLRGVDLAFECEVPSAVVLVGDELRLRQVVLNLVTNALKFTEEGQVTVKAKVDQNARLSVEVIDTGVGIQEADLPKLFQPFSQVDSSARRRFGGTGLGLVICARIIEEMGGLVGVESTVGEGSRFWFEAPMKWGHLAEQRQASDLQSALPPGLRVLLVEDNPTNQMVARRMLTALGCEVVVAGDGAAALKLELARRFDVIFMDCHMPGLSGWETTQRIRRHEAESPQQMRTPIIALTASALPEERERCFVAGMDDFLAKPLSRMALARTLSRWAPVH